MPDTNPVGANSRIASLIRKLASFGPGRNGVFALGQALVALACGLMNYRLVVIHEGLAALGLWSLLMIFGGVASTFDFSGATALARQVARQPEDFPEAGRPLVIHTVLLTALAINSVLVVIALAIAPLVMPAFVEPAQMPLAIKLLPWAVSLVLVTPFAYGIAASLDGLMRADVRAKLMACAISCGLFVSWQLIPKFGLFGLATGQIAQWLIVILGGWLILRSSIPGMGWFPFRWDYKVFRQSTIYAIKIRLVGSLAALSDPLAKLCINHVGGTTAVGIYELAARLIVQLRDLVFTSLVPYLPVFAALSPSETPFSDQLRRAQRYAMLASIVISVISLAAAPVICLIILNEASVDVIRANALLTTGWTANLMSQPLYVAAQGQDRLRWNMASHAFAAVGLIGFTALIVPIWGSQAVVGGVSIGLMMAAFAAQLGNARQFGQTRLVMAMSGEMLIAYVSICCLCALAWLEAPWLADRLNEFVHGLRT